jgi:hypothetical protein
MNAHITCVVLGYLFLFSALYDKTIISYIGCNSKYLYWNLFWWKSSKPTSGIKKTALKHQLEEFHYVRQLSFPRLTPRRHPERSTECFLLLPIQLSLLSNLTVRSNINKLQHFFLPPIQLGLLSNFAVSLVFLPPIQWTPGYFVFWDRVVHAPKSHIKFHVITRYNHDEAVLPNYGQQPC